MLKELCTVWIIKLPEPFTSSRCLIIIEWCQFWPVPYMLYQLNGIIFYQFHISDTNWMVSVLTSSIYLTPIEWYHILPVPDIWYHLNGISFNKFLISDTNWMVSYSTNTVCFIILYTPRFFLEIRVIIKILKNPWYPINCD